MKKTLFKIGWIALAIYALGCGRAAAEKKQIGTFENHEKLKVRKTLNGYNERDALNMINYCYRKFIHKPDACTKSLCVWFKKDDIKKMYAVLRQESYGVDAANGVRFYLGLDSANDNGKFHQFKLLLVTTRMLAKPPKDPKTSSYVDYFVHYTNKLDKKMGDPYYCQQKPDDGALLYTNNTLTGYDCPYGTNLSGHELQLKTAQGCARARMGSKTPFTTLSDTFDIVFIKWLFSIIAENRSFTGLRVYLGYGCTGAKTDPSKDIFMLVPTSKTDNSNRVDNFQCLEKIKPYPIPHLTDGGYDKGELCPDNCDPGLDPSGSDNSKQSQLRLPSMKKKGTVK